MQELTYVEMNISGCRADLLSIYVTNVNIYTKIAFSSAFLHLSAYVVMT